MSLNFLNQKFITDAAGPSEPFDSSTPKSMLRKPISKELGNYIIYYVLNIISLC